MWGRHAELPIETKGVRSPRAGIKEGYEPSDMDAENPLHQQSEFLPIET